MNYAVSQPQVIFSTGSLYGLDTAHCFALAAEAGCNGVEVMCDARWSTRDPAYLQALSDRYAQPVRVLHTPFARELPGWRNPTDEVGRITQTLALAEQLGAETIVVHLPHWLGRAALQLSTCEISLPWRSPFGAVAHWMRNELPALQQQTPVKIAVENLPALPVGPLLINPARWNTPSAWANVHRWLTLDTTHCATFGIDPCYSYRGARGRVCHLHLSNYDGRQHRLPQEGRLNLAALLHQLKTDGFAGTVCLELHPDALGFPDEAAIRANLQASVAFCRKHLTDVGDTNSMPYRYATPSESDC
jgi:sugar phosphate isomerase/epimerase